MAANAPEKLADQPPASRGSRRGSGMFGGLVAGVQEKAAQAAQDYSNNAETLKVLSKETQEALKNIDKHFLVKAGRIVKNLKTSKLGGGFSSEEMSLLVHSLYVSKSDEDLEASFEMLY